MAVGGGSNETAVPELLRVLDLTGAVVTLDAAGCQEAIAAHVREQGGDYVPAVKGNQPALREAVHAVFGRACDADFEGVDDDGHESAGRGHGRAEEWCVTVAYDPEGLPPGRPDVAAVGRPGGVTASTSHSCSTSRRGTAAELGALIRRQWAVEDGLHWRPDVSFGEDRNRTAAGRAGASLGLVRRVAASLVKQDTGKASVQAGRLTAARDDAYLLRLLQGTPTV